MFRFSGDRSPHSLSLCTRAAGSRCPDQHDSLKEVTRWNDSAGRGRLSGEARRGEVRAGGGGLMCMVRSRGDEREMRGGG